MAVPSGAYVLRWAGDELTYRGTSGRDRLYVE
jgi:hypothetical protein